ncbi:tetratricopeptide repeat protein [Polaribacter sp. 11A2H]|uniref:tetratricopeptide repeat protein n=1 Tax=Polaribacter sp. 11A2H TaxID=2687290 RepID=UPI00140C8306|nr:hypothetical protein [Polaribacter sp. 11A2H]
MNNFESDYMSGVKAYKERNFQNAIYFFEKSMSALKFAGLPEEFEKDSMETGYFNLGNAKKEVADFEGAIDCYKIVLKSNPTRPEYERVYMDLSECCFEINNPLYLKIALEYLGNCTKYFPNNISAYMNRGIAAIKLNNLPIAKIAFESAKNLGNNDAEGFLNKYC